MPAKIEMGPQGLVVPDDPIIPFIEGDGTGPDIWAAAVRVLEAAVQKAYGDQKKIVWKEVSAGEQAYNQTGSWLPEETVDAFREHLVAIKGPLTTPVGGGIRSLNVALRQTLDLYACVRRCALDWRRGRQRRTRREEATARPVKESLFVGPLEEQERRAAIEAALHTLPATHNGTAVTT